MKKFIALSAVGALGFQFLMSSISGFMTESKAQIDQKQQATISQFE
jgi:hypothetical protein